MTQEKQKLWTKYFILACMINLLTGFAMNMLNSSLAKYVYSLYGNASLSGIMNGVFAVFAITGRMAAGRLSDQHGRRLLVVLGCVIFGVSILGFGVFPAIPALILFRGLQGLGYSTAATADYAAGSDIIPLKRMNEGVGLLGLGYSFAMAIGPTLAILLIDGRGYGMMFAVAALLVFLGALSGLGLNYPKKPAGAGSKALIEPAALPATVTQLLNCMAQAAINSFIVIYAESRGFSHIGLFFTCMAVAMAVTRLFAGRIVDRIGPVAGVAPGIGLSMIGFGLLLANCSNGLFLLAGFLIGFSMGVVNPVLQASAVQAAPEGRYGAANGTYQLSNDISNGVGAVLWGLVIDRWGYGAMFMGCLLFCGLSLLYLFTGFRRSLGKERT